MPTEEAIVMETFFHVANKEGEDVKFRLNPVQRSLDEGLTGRDIIPKARQEGVSTYFLGRYTAKCMMRNNFNSVIISHESEATQRLLARSKYFIDTMEGGRRPEVTRNSLNNITFAKTKSSLWIGTAGARSFGRGDTIHALHASEYAFWPDGQRLMTGLLQAVPLSGEIAIESTGNGVGNDYYKRCNRARDGSSQYKLHFFDWQSFPEYSLPLSGDERVIFKRNLNEDWEEIELYKSGRLTLEQLAWRRLKLEDFDYNLNMFKQEYPMTMDECFQATGRSIFYKVNYKPTQDWIQQDHNLHVLDPHPIQGHVYSMGVDPSGGVGQDNAAIEIFDVELNEQVAEWTDNFTSPDNLAHIATDIGKMFNDTFMTVESNNHGLVTLDQLQDIYPSELLFDTSGGTAGLTDDDKPLGLLGLRTTTRTKPLMIGRLRTAVARDTVVHSSALKSEMDTYIEVDGKFGAEAGCHDDRVMASACAIWGMESAALAKEESDYEPEEDESIYKDPFSFEEIMKRVPGFGRSGKQLW